MNVRLDRRAALAALALPLLLGAARPVQNPAVRVLLVGGGPNPAYNQVAIESNVRWVDSLLPGGIARTILFCDGRADTPTVQFARQPSDAEAGMAILFPPPGSGHGAEGMLQYRPTTLRKVDGPTTRDGFSASIANYAKGTDPVLLYFTGHGSPNRRDLDNNQYDLWREGGLTPQALAAQIARLPADTPVTVVMVQCFSGAFGNLLFENADPKGPLVGRRICGFFAATREREAAGCTPEVNEAEYRDFTSSFFAGLTGTDRVGRKVQRPDYDKNGHIGFDEAYAYALITDPSIDVPVVTSDVFLRRFVPVTDDAELAEVPWDKIRAAASPSQRAALDGLCAALGPRAQTPERMRTALDEFRRRSRQGDAFPRYTEGVQRDIIQWRETLTAQFPALAAFSKAPSADPEQARADRVAYAADYKKAVAWLAERPESTAKLNEVRKRVDAISNEVAADAIAGARWLRLLRLSKSVVLEMRLREMGDKGLLARFESLKKMEAENPLKV